MVSRLNHSALSGSRMVMLQAIGALLIENHVTRAGVRANSVDSLRS